MPKHHFSLPYPHIRYSNPKHAFSGFFICFHRVCYIITISMIHIFLGILCMSAVVIIAFGAYASYYSDKILPHTFIADIPFSSMTYAEAQQKLNAKIQSYQSDRPITLYYQKTLLQPSLSDLGITIDAGETMNRAFQYGHSKSIFQNIIDSCAALFYKKNLTIVYALNRDQFNAYLYPLQRQFEKPMHNAAISILDGKPTIQKEESGTSLNIIDIELSLDRSTLRLKKNILELPIATFEPQISEDDIVPTFQFVETILGEPIQLLHDQNKYFITPEIIALWLNFKEERKEDWKSMNEKKYLQIYLKNENILQYIKKTIAKEINVDTVSSKIIISAQKTEVLEKGKSGKKLNVDKTLALIQEKLLDSSDRVIELPVEVIEPPLNSDNLPTPVLKEGKHIIVSLEKQIAYAFDGEKLEYAAKVSTGIPGHVSPKGTYKVYGKSAKQKMSGPGYYLPNVPWILWYHGDYSLHGTYWHHNFGHPMSHGCTNLSIDDAKWFFEWAPVGTPVINID